MKPKYPTLTQKYVSEKNDKNKSIKKFIILYIIVNLWYEFLKLLCLSGKE